MSIILLVWFAIGWREALVVAVVIPVTLVLNYAANRFWTFGDVARGQTAVRKA